MKLVTAAVMRELDRHTIEDLGVPGIDLMEAAGRGVADRALAMLRDSGRSSALVLCGPGNNGGDGFVAARHLAAAGIDVDVALIGQAAALKGDAATAYQALSGTPVRVHEVPAGVPADLLDAGARGIVLDAIFGTGLARDVAGPFAAAVDAASALPCPRLAVDLPTGIDSDTGRILGTAFRADATVTFAIAKLGHAVWPGRGFCGDVTVVPIGIAQADVDAAPGATWLERADAARAFPPRRADSFKNDFGHLLVVGGVPGKAGAVLLSALGALRSGAGLITIATHDVSAARLEGRVPELMVEPGFATVDGWLQPLDGFATLLARKDAVVAGPGLSTAPGAARVLEAALESGIPAVVDADALNLVAADPAGAWRLSPSRVLTPHPGEAGRLLGVPSAQVQADRVSAARELAARTGATIVLKGAGTLVASPDGRLAVNPTGGPALATAGSGDVLSGVLGALLARRIEPFDAACAAVFVHGCAGDLAGRRLTPESTGSSDVIDSLPAAIAGLRDGGGAR